VEVEGARDDEPLTSPQLPGLELPLTDGVRH
jgi:hypothetical protein